MHQASKFTFGLDKHFPNYFIIYFLILLPSLGDEDTDHYGCFLCQDKIMKGCYEIHTQHSMKFLYIWAFLSEIFIILLEI